MFGYLPSGQAMTGGHDTESASGDRLVEAATMRAAARFGAGITRYEPRDAAELAEFQRRQFGPDSRQVDRSRFEWLFEQNPCRSPEGPGLWLCRRGGVVVGQQGEIPFDLLVGDVVHRAAWALGLMVVP